MSRFLALLFICAQAWAQDYPAKPIRISGQVLPIDNDARTSA